MRENNIFNLIIKELPVWKDLDVFEKVFILILPLSTLGSFIFCPNSRTAILLIPLGIVFLGGVIFAAAWLMDYMMDHRK